MRTNTLRKTTLGKTLAVTAVASLSLFTAACGSDDEETSSSDDASSTPESSDDSASADDAGADLVGPGCADYAAQVPSGAGSIEGMAAAPLSEAASGNPLLTTLVKAVAGQLNPEVNLVSTLDGGEFTVFAPVDDAFAKLDAATLAAVQTPEGAATLESVLTYHVIPGQISPDEIVGDHKTVNGATVTVGGTPDALTVGDASANVICGGVKTANATVYLIDSVLMPPMA